MADISVRGYVGKPQSKSSSKGPFSTYTLKERIKDPKAEKGFRYAFFNVTDFNAEQPPEDGSFVTVKGWLKPREYEKDGVKRLVNDIIAQEVEVSPPRGGSGPSTQPQAPAAAEFNSDQWKL